MRMTTERTCLGVLLGVVLALCGVATSAFAHGTTIDYTTTTATMVEITATFDSGEPMRGAQVLIFAPDDAVTPWQTGVCDDVGRFSFTPDSALPGTWEVQVRQSGHGSAIYIEVGESAAGTAHSTATTPQSVAQGSTSYTPVQIIVMSACVVWGLVGTALFFASRGQRKATAAAQQTDITSRESAPTGS